MKDFLKKYNIDSNILKILGCSFVLIIFIIPFILTRTWGLDCMAFTESTGWIGDTLGGITAPFIGFVNIILLIWTLQKQIEFNKEQLKTQKDEQFKAAFFQMVQTQRELLHEVSGKFLSRNMKGNVVGGKVSGLDYFHDAGLELTQLFKAFDGNIDDQIIRRNLCEKYHVTDELMTEYTQADNVNQMRIVYDQFFKEHYELGHYFRHLYHILKFISDEKRKALEGISDEHEEDRIKTWYKGYADLLQAILSVEELKIAYYNCASFENAKALFLEFQFTENLTKGNLIRPDKDKMTDFIIKERY